jgi:hypothetical protein
MDDVVCGIISNLSDKTCVILTRDSSEKEMVISLIDPFYCKITYSDCNASVIFSSVNDFKQRAALYIGAFAKN